MKVKNETDTVGTLSREHSYLGEFKGQDALNKGHLSHGKIERKTQGTSRTLDPSSSGNVPKKGTNERY